MVVSAFDDLAVTYKEFQRHIGKAGLTLREFAELVCMNRASISNLSSKGEVPSHLAIIAALLGEMAEQRVEFRSVLARVDVKPKRARGSALECFGRTRPENRVSAALAEKPKELGESSGT